MFFAAVSAALCAASVASASQFRQIQRIWAVEEDKIEAARAAFPRAFEDGVIIATFSGLKLGTPEIRDFERHKAFAERMKSQGVEVQVCISSTIGHTDAWTQENDCPKMAGSDGKAAKAVMCPRSPEFAARMRAIFGRYARLHPSVIWVDDDFRMPHHPPVDFGCFCDSCVEGFCAASGVRLDRAGVKSAILSGAKVDGVDVRRAWRKWTQGALTSLVGEISRAVHEVDDGIAIGFMCCNPQGMAYAPFDFRRWIALARNRDGEVWFRHGSGAYTDFTPYASGGIVAKNVAIARNCAATEGQGVVNLTEEVTCPYDRRTKSLRMTFLEAALNIGFAGADGATYDAIKPNLDEQLRPDAIVADVHRRHGRLERMRSLIAGKRQIGVYPFFSSDVWLANGAVKSLWDLGSLGMEDWQPLLYIGIPFTFREKDASLLLLSGKSARAVPADRLEYWRGRGIVADRTAAAEVGGLDPARSYVFPAEKWSNAVWPRKESLEIKDALDRLAGGRMPVRLDTCVRMATSVWEDPSSGERVVFLFNLDFDDARDVRLAFDAEFSAELMQGEQGWLALGRGDSVSLPPVPAWSVAVVRLAKNGE